MLDKNGREKNKQAENKKQALLRKSNSAVFLNAEY